MRTPLSVLPFLLLLLLAAAPTGATRLAPLSVAELVRRAEQVCCVRCESAKPELDPRTGLVFTRIRFRLLERMKGEGDGETLELRLAGGRLGDRATVVPGMPVFRPGEECVLLLGRRNAAGHPTLLQASRGTIPLRRDARGQRFLGRPVTGFERLPDDRRVSLARFREAVRDVAETGEGR